MPSSEVKAFNEMLQLYSFKPLYGKEDYAIWKSSIRAVLRLQGLWKYTSKVPALAKNTPTSLARWKKKSNEVADMIFLHLSEGAKYKLLGRPFHINFDVDFKDAYGLLCELDRKFYYDDFSDHGWWKTDSTSSTSSSDSVDSVGDLSIDGLKIDEVDP